MLTRRQCVDSPPGGVGGTCVIHAARPCTAETSDGDRPFGHATTVRLCVRATALWIAAATLCMAEAVSGQRLVVVVRDSILQSGVRGALVNAVDQASGSRVFGVTDEQGRVALALTGSGAWATAVRRIGIVPVRAPTVRVDVGQTVYVTVSTTSAQFRLPAVEVTADAPACAVEPVGNSRVAVLWEQMTLALRAATAVAGTRPGDEALHVSMFERDLSRNRETRAERSVREGPGTGRPFYAAHPDSLVARGYVQKDPTGGLQYFAPDETVLLSDGFLRTHCFEAPTSVTDSSLAELRFTPVRKRSLPDVAGTAFVDVATGELRRIDFQYVNTDRLFEGRRPDVGGDVAFRLLSDGRWIVTAWTIRMPTYMRVPGRVERSLLGYREVGGTIQVLARTTALGDDHRAVASLPDVERSTSAQAERSSDGRRTPAYDIERRSGFTMRRRSGPGIFLDSAALGRTSSRTALHLLQGVDGITLIDVPPDIQGVPAEGDPDLAREWRAGAELPMMPAGAADDGTPLQCLVKVYLDGRRAGLAQLAALPARDVVALEFYRSPRDVPAGFRREGNRCGTAIFWSFGER
ncbi:MAG: carboxypeptidase-like regulatory domain-containing protein [Gemmatimonadota bacterium]